MLVRCVRFPPSSGTLTAPGPHRVDPRKGRCHLKCYLVKHFYNNEVPKLIGIYSSPELAHEAVTALAPKPGFVKASPIITDGSDKDGFRVREFAIDELAFRTVTPKALIKKRHKVYLLEHHYTDTDATLHYQAIGVFSEAKHAKQHAVKLKNRPEYIHAAELIEPTTVGNGFRIMPLELDETDWQEGFQVPY